jgi:hypothetical protein
VDVSIPVAFGIPWVLIVNINGGSVIYAEFPTEHMCGLARAALHYPPDTMSSCQDEAVARAYWPTLFKEPESPEKATAP